MNNAKQSRRVMLGSAVVIQARLENLKKEVAAEKKKVACQALCLQATFSSQSCVLVIDKHIVTVLHYLLAQGGRHDYDYVTDYLYVLLPHLFPAESDAAAIICTKTDTMTSDSILYSISGQKIGKTRMDNLPKGVYVAKGKKYVVR